MADDEAIHRTWETEHLDEIEGVGRHQPQWCDEECPDCDSGHCLGHLDVLACKECLNDWPCEPVKLVAQELLRFADQVNARRALHRRAEELLQTRHTEVDAADEQLRRDRAKALAEMSREAAESGLDEETDSLPADAAQQLVDPAVWRSTRRNGERKTDEGHG